MSTALVITLNIIDKLSSLALRLAPEPPPSPDGVVLDLKVTDLFPPPPPGERSMFRLPDDKQVTVTINPRSRRGNPARIDGTPSWSSSNPDLVTVTPSEDGRSAVVRPTGSTGTAQVSVTCDADLGEGIRNITGVLDVEVVEGEAATIGLDTGALEDQPE